LFAEIKLNGDDEFLMHPLSFGGSNLLSFGCRKIRMLYHRSVDMSFEFYYCACCIVDGLSSLVHTEMFLQYIFRLEYRKFVVAVCWLLSLGVVAFLLCALAVLQRSAWFPWFIYHSFLYISFSCEMLLPVEHKALGVMV
jgi:ABC-type uncharacterized transport system YnjBCD permease subunit